MYRRIGIGKINAVNGREPSTWEKKPQGLSSPLSINMGTKKTQSAKSKFNLECKFKFLNKPVLFWTWTGWGVFIWA